LALLPPKPPAHFRLLEQLQHSASAAVSATESSKFPDLYRFNP